MQEGSQKPRHKLYGGIAASVALHVIIAVALFVRLPAAEMQPPKEESVSVEIVPPPEEQPDEEKPAEQEQALKLTMPEQKPEEQQAPPPEPEQQPTEEAKAEPPPSPPPAQQEQAEAEQSPPTEDPPAPPEEQADAQPPPPATPEPAPEAQQQNAEQQPANGRPLPVLRPVFEFGQDATGSDVSPDGNASEAVDEAKVEDTESPSENGEVTEEPKTEAPAEAAAPNLPQDVAPPSLETANADPLATSDDGMIEGILANIAAEPVGKPVEKEKPTEDKAQAGKPMKEVKRLFSQTDTSDAVATTAMGGLTRSARVKQLCGTELTMQLIAANHRPDMLPNQGLAEGNILNVASAAFHEKGQWHDLGYRCEIDQNATKVVSFAIRVGEAIPRNQWKQRGLPTF